MKKRDIMEAISKLKWNWAGHVARRTDNRWTTRITFWTPRGHTRNRGRPRTRWRNDLDSFLKLWHCVAQNVVQWRSIGKAYVQRRTFSGRKLLTDCFQGKGGMVERSTEIFLWSVSDQSHEIQPTMERSNFRKP